MKLGFLVNPVAGMGGAVGLKGTDGAEIRREAERRGATRTAHLRARETLTALRRKALDLTIVTCGGGMGAAVLEMSGMQHEVVYEPQEPSTSLDTAEAVGRFVARDVDLVLFAGGDGTARDVVGVTGTDVPVVGIPAGVKMHSSVFAVVPEEAADLVESFARSGELTDAEVMDVDEDDFRAGIVRASLFATAKVPDDVEHLQSTKSSYHSGQAETQAQEIGQYVAEIMDPETMYIVGPGSTTTHIAAAMGAEKTPLGVDVYLSRALLARDVSEGGILSLLRDHPKAAIVVSPIGSQGFVFGRGNQQISAEVIGRVGTDAVMVIATQTKLMGTPALRVDTGDPELDDELRGPVKVITGYRRRRLDRIV